MILQYERINHVSNNLVCFTLFCAGRFLKCSETKIICSSTTRKNAEVTLSTGAHDNLRNFFHCIDYYAWNAKLETGNADSGGS